MNKRRNNLDLDVADILRKFVSIECIIGSKESRLNNSSHHYFHW